MLKVKVIKIGRSLGVVLPEEVVARLNAKCGDALYMAECPKGYTLANDTREVDRQRQTAKKLMERYKKTILELAE